MLPPEKSVSSEKSIPSKGFDASILFNKIWVSLTLLCGLIGFAVALILLFKENFSNAENSLLDILLLKESDLDRAVSFGKGDTDMDFFIANPGFAIWVFFVILEVTVWFTFIFPIIGIIYRLYTNSINKNEGGVKWYKFLLKFVLTYIITLWFIGLLYYLFASTIYDREAIVLDEIEDFDNKVKFLTKIGLSIGGLCLAGFLAVDYSFGLIRNDVKKGIINDDIADRFKLTSQYLQSLLVIGGFIIGFVFLSTGILYNSYNEYRPNENAISEDSTKLFMLKTASLEKSYEFHKLQSESLLKSWENAKTFEDTKKYFDERSRILGESQKIEQAIQEIVIAKSHLKPSKTMVPYDFVYLFSGLFSLILFIFYFPVAIEEKVIQDLLIKTPLGQSSNNIVPASVKSKILTHLPGFIRKGLPILSPVLATTLAQILELIFNS
jgi:hypothetical protein